MDRIFGKVPSGERYLNFLGPAGGSRTRKGAFAFQDNITWLVETEIAFSVEEQHFIGTTAGQIGAKHPSWGPELENGGVIGNR